MKYRELEQTMEKRIAKAHVECNKQGWFSVYTEKEFPFGFFGEGCSAEEAVKDFLNVFAAMREDYFQSTGENIDAEFEFVYDTNSNKCSRQRTQMRAQRAESKMASAASRIYCIFAAHFSMFNQKSKSL